MPELRNEVHANMKLYLAGTNPYVRKYYPDATESEYKINILQSFFYPLADWQKMWLIENPDRFMLDSGVFTFLNSNREAARDIDRYTEAYIRFILNNDTALFFEMDADQICGLSKVEKLRKRIEKATGKQSIPVWHPNRGKEYFIQMCKDYDYVSFGAFITDHIPLSKLKPVLPWFINTAHKYGTKIHGLGLGSPSMLTEYNFDSVDTTSWKGTIFGNLWQFNGRTLVKIKSRGKTKIKEREAARHNLLEWMKFGQFLEAGA